MSLLIAPGGAAVGPAAGKADGKNPVISSSILANHFLVARIDDRSYPFFTDERQWCGKS
jgi:hypothetical protein